MANETITKIEVTRTDIFDMLNACLAAKQWAGDCDGKWDRLYNKLKAELNRIDEKFWAT